MTRRRDGEKTAAERQADPLSEYLSLHRVLEAADHKNSRQFTAGHLADLATVNFGDLAVLPECREPNGGSMPSRSTGIVHKTSCSGSRLMRSCGSALRSTMETRR
jgi:hypothetical protein